MKKRHTFHITQRVQIVGILNTTPDSYHDGGQFVTVEKALERAAKMITEGADIIEVGGESSGPNSKDVSTEEELTRTIDIIKAIKEKFPSAQIGIDTYKSAVAREAIKAGVMMVNDVTAGRGDPEMFRTIAEGKVSLVLMYSKDPTPRTTIAQTQYEDVIETISSFLHDRKQAAITAGVPAPWILVDPGLGHFVSSDPKYSFEIITKLKEFLYLGSSIFLSPSRKSFLAGPENLKTVDRLPGTIVASAMAVLNGASYIRTHDVLEIRRACDIAIGFLRS